MLHTLHAAVQWAAEGPLKQALLLTICIQDLAGHAAEATLGCIRGTLQHTFAHNTRGTQMLLLLARTTAGDSVTVVGLCRRTHCVHGVRAGWLHD
jgi:hypothetical protein